MLLGLNRTDFDMQILYFIYMYDCRLYMYMWAHIYVQVHVCFRFFPKNSTLCHDYGGEHNAFGRLILWPSLYRYIDTCVCKVLLSLIVRELSNFTPKPCNTQFEFWTACAQMERNWSNAKSAATRTNLENLAAQNTCTCITVCYIEKLDSAIKSSIGKVPPQ